MNEEIGGKLLNLNEYCSRFFTARGRSLSGRIAITLLSGVLAIGLLQSCGPGPNGANSAATRPMGGPTEIGRPTAMLAGEWDGFLKQTLVVADVRVRLDQHADGTWAGIIYSPNWGTTDWALEGLQIDGSRIRFNVGSEVMGRAGCLIAEMRMGSIAGTYSYGDEKYELFLSRKRLEASRRRRPQVPKGPFPYTNVDVIVPNTAVRIAGNLMLPLRPESKPVAAVLLLRGSRAERWDPGIPGNPRASPREWIVADRLCRNGFAVLRLDSRGKGGSGGRYDDATISEMADDAVAAMNYLRRRNDVLSDRVAIVGTSEGAHVGMIAATHSRVALLVLLSGLSLQPEEVFLEQTRRVSEAFGDPKKYTDAKIQFAQQLFDLARGDLTPDDIRREMLAWAHQRRIDQELGTGLLEHMINHVGTARIRSTLRDDPSKHLSQLKIPVLTINGDRDLLVAADKNAAEFERIFKKAHMPDATVRIIPELSHGLTKTRDGLGGVGDEWIDPQVLDLINGWLVERTR